MDNMIGQRIKSRRKELKITLKQIEEKCGIATGNLSGIETGRYLPSAVALIELSKILECSTDWILTGKSLKSTNIEMFDIKESEKRLLDNYRCLNTDNQEEVLDYIEFKINRQKKHLEINEEPEISMVAENKIDKTGSQSSMA